MNNEKKPGISRRRFMKQATLAAGGGMLLSSVPLGGVYAAGSDTIRVGVIGCGGRGTGAAHQALQADEGGKIVALADAFEDRLPQCYSNLNDKHGERGRLDVPEEMRFTGLEGHKNVIDEIEVGVVGTAPVLV